MDITTLLTQHESSTLEFKRHAPENHTLAAIISAFANTAGGDLLLGVDDVSKDVVGVDEKQLLEIEQRVSSVASTCIDPQILPICKFIHHKNSLLLLIHIEMGYQKPYKVISGRNAGKIFIRGGSSTRVADEPTIQMLTIQSQGKSWDTLPCIDASQKDLSRELIDEFIERRQHIKALPLPRRIDLSWLKKMNIVVEAGGKVHLTMAGTLLFTAQPQHWLPQSELDMARFKGSSARVFLDKKTAKGPLWKLYDDALQFFRKHIPLEVRRTAHGRSEDYAYPELAFREFMINALCHRIYGTGSSSTKLAIFDDIIEITNYGSLPVGLELEDLGTGISVIRNPVIARAFNEIGLIEGWGTGIQIAQRELAEKGLPWAKITAKGPFTQVSSAWRWPEDLHQRDKLILRLALSEGRVTSASIQKELGCSERSARGYLSALVKKGLLRKQGTTRGAEYAPV